MKGRFQLGLALLHPDGFASLKSTWREGVITTKPFRWPGGQLVVNGQELGGSRTNQAYLQVAVLDKDGQEIPGYEHSESDILAGDFPAGVPSWSDKPQNLDPLIGQTIRLRFFLRQAEIFSFRSVSPE